MHIPYSLLLAVVLLMGGDVYAKPEVDFLPFHSCVEELKGFQKESQIWLPTILVSFDKNLKRMQGGVAAMEFNLHLLEDQYKRGVFLPHQTHLIHNAIAGCLAFSADYQKRMTWFFWLCVCVVTCLGYLLVWAVTLSILNVIPVSRKPPPVDRH